MNAASCLKIAIDTPCGLLSEMPEQAIVFQANHVFTFHSPKPAFLLPHAEKFVPDFSVLDIRLSLPEPGKDVFFFTEENDIRRLLRPRPKFSHKGTFGHALIVAGSEGKMGAAVLAARACLRSGAGLLSMQIPACGRDVLQSAVPEAMVISSPQYSFISVLPETAAFQAIGIGPGIGTSQESSEVLRALFASCKPLVLDADAINILALHPDLLELLPPDTILTPHPKEFSRITGFSGSPYQRWFAARDFAVRYKIYLILKGAYSLICFPDGRVCFNGTGNSGMAKGGSGDVLTGLLTGLLASGYPPEDSCRLGVWLHGCAGDLAAINLSSVAMNAFDLISFLPQAWKSILERG
jgi:NAD(P)H-hydrate epimerase